MTSHEGRPHRTTRVRPGVLLEHDVVVPMSDGLGLRVNVFRPEGDVRSPVIVTHGVYGKDVEWSSAPPYRAAWQELLRKLPDLAKHSSLRFMRWEMPDPERWVPWGYAVIHADARGTGKTPGHLEPMSPREIEDYCALIAWAASQPWSNGRVGVMGISYYAITAWRVAAERPAGLAAIVPWEGAFDHYRDITMHGGIPSRFFIDAWYRRQVLANAHGRQSPALRDAISGRSGASPMSDGAAFPSGHADLSELFEQHPFDDAFHVARTPDPAAIEVPLLSVGNWGGVGLHLRGNIEGFVNARSPAKWLRIHSGDHFSPFYSEASLAMQRRFLDHFLRDADNGWEREPRVSFVVRDPHDPTRRRQSDRWPLPETRWTQLYLDGERRCLSETPSPTSIELGYASTSPGVTFCLPPRRAPMELAGPVRAKLWVRCERADMDLFVVLRLLDPNGHDVTFEGANAAAVPVTLGWLRLSHRSLDATRSLPFRPYHSHTSAVRLAPGEIVAANVEIWPTSVVVPRGYSLALTVLAHDFTFGRARSALAGALAKSGRKLPLLAAYVTRGTAPFLHDARDPGRFGGVQHILCGGEHDSHLCVPVIPG